MSSTLFDKVWDSHVVSTLPSGGNLLYIDRHLVHEVAVHEVASENLVDANAPVR